MQQPAYILRVNPLSTLNILFQFHLNRDNKRRDAEPRDDQYDSIYIERVNNDGTVDEIRVEKVRPSHTSLSVAGLTFYMFPCSIRDSWI